jgi:AraC-like DNA-binding protein
MKNNDKSIITTTTLEDGFSVIKINNKSSNNQFYTKEVNNNYIQLFFGLNGKGSLMYNNGNYSIDINENKSLVMFNPLKDLPINIEITSNSKIVILLIKIEKFHSFFSEFTKHISFLDIENKNKKYYSAKDLLPKEIVVLNELFTNKIHQSLGKLYSKGKVFELLSLYFNLTNDDDEKCPFLEDEDNVLKIKKAKEIIIDRMVEPPSLNELANEIGLTLKKLKDGFKHIYGETVFNFLIDYKLDYARKLLESKKYNVTEISEQIGYSTSSHFIAAFKKKFGTTPKKYLGKI